MGGPGSWTAPNRRRTAPSRRGGPRTPGREPTDGGARRNGRSGRTTTPPIVPPYGLPTRHPPESSGLPRAREARQQPGERAAPGDHPQEGAARPLRGSWPVPARHEAEALAHRRRHPTAARGPGDPMPGMEQQTAPRSAGRHPRGRTGRRVAYGFLAVTAVMVGVFCVTPFLLSASAGLAPHYADQGSLVAVAFLGHVVAGGLALLLSPMQIAARLRARAPRLHRVAGRVMFAAIAVAGCTSLVIAPFDTAGPVGTIGFGITGIVWLFCAAAALRGIRRRDVAAHRRWAVRTFALTYTAVTLRLLSLPLTALLVVLGMNAGVAGARAYAALALLSWVIDLAAAEWYLATRRRRAVNRHRRSAPERPVAAAQAPELGMTA